MISNKTQLTVFMISLAVLIPVIGFAGETIHHDIKVRMDVEKNWVEVEDTIRLPESFVAQRKFISFKLHQDLQPKPKNTGVRISTFSGKGSLQNNGIETFQLSLGQEFKTITITYQGKIFQPVQLRAGGDDEDHGVFGTVSLEGIFLSGGTYWYPVFGEELLTFRLEVELQPAWDAVSQGRRTIHDKNSSGTKTVWESTDPQEEIYLIGGKFTEYGQSMDGIDAMVFLRGPDASLAERYLGVTGPYIQMYQNMIGPYPYEKFTLVENFWETGFGMPSFTLLGPRVVRFPFILHSSYPHEILHNWWGNGVYVNRDSGNWSEGLTTYLADHLFKEQEGKGHEFRRDALQRYTDYVGESKDFALTGFTSRDSPATQAVGYGKTMMFFHMLRRQLGDEIFIRALQRFYEMNRFRRASYYDIQEVFSKTAGRSLKEEFAQWIERAGAPTLIVKKLSAQKQKKGYLLRGTIEQVQPGPGFQLDIPVAVHLKNGDQAHQTRISMNQKKIDFKMPLPDRPYRFDLDPEYDLFRRLDPGEIPPSLSGSLGAEKILFVLPSKSPDNLRDGFKDLAQGMAGRALGETTFKMDDDLERLPNDHSVWILGWDNTFLEKFIPLLENYSAIVNSERVKVIDEVFQKEKHSFVFTIRRPEISNLTMTWIASDHLKAFTGLGRKLPHYGKYSYLVFDGEEPTNISKGQWPVLNSPLSVLIPNENGSFVTDKKAVFKPRVPLAQRPDFQQ